MFETFITILLLGAGAITTSTPSNTATGEQPCEVQTAVMSQLETGKVLYYTCQ